MTLRFVILFAVSVLPFISRSQAIDTSTCIFSPSFRTLQATVNDNFFAPNVINLNSDDRITIEFDEISDDRRYLRACVVHCNADWQPSPLTDSEIITGFNEIEINDVEFSQATTVHYVHYRITLPDENFNFKVSGNYLLKVYEESNPEQTLLQIRFHVSEATALINGEVSTRTDIDYNNRHQQLSVSVNCDHAPLNNIYSDLKITLTQNNRTDNEVSLTTPTRVSGRTAIYEHQRPLIFPSGNEYRRFETVSTGYPGLHVDNISFSDPYYHMMLAVDEPRALTQYLYDKTQNGRFVIREQNSSDSQTEADYVVVHFYLDSPHYNGLDIYLDGDFVNRRLDASSRMIYDSENSRYEKIMLLKQGAYNYQYITVGKNSPQSATATVEGDFFQTVNEYQVKAYTRRHGERYDRLIGFSTIFSTK